MDNSIKVVVGLICACLVSAACGLYALFHGFFDYGTFEIEQSQWSPSKRIAVIGRRSDHQALSGDQYFVAIGDKPFSSEDLRHAYYYDGVAFRADSDCLSIHWRTAQDLIVRCEDHSIEAGQIAVQKHQIGDVVVSYENIPNDVIK